MAANSFRTPAVFIVCGAPGSGKSTFIRSFIYNKAKVGALKYGVVFARTAFNDGYDYLPDGFVHNSYSEATVKKLLNVQIKAKKQGVDAPAFLILDDCVGSVNFNSPFFSELITTYRHYNLTIIIATQYINKVPPTVRECAQYTLIYQATTARSLRALFDSYGQSFDNYEAFKKALEKSTGNYHALLVKNAETNVSAKFIKYRAPLIKTAFKLNFGRRK